jgi:hypothetical protein
METPVVENNVVISKSLDYKIQASSAPKYKMSLLTPQSGGTSVTILPTSTVESLIELPAGKAYNLANSVLNMTFTPGIPGNAGRFNWYPVDFCPLIHRIQLYSRGGTQLADISFLNKYLNIAQKLNTRNERFLNRSANDFLYPSNTLTNVVPAIRPVASAASTKAYIEPAYALVGADNTATPVQQFQFRLGDIPHSVFSIDKDLYFNEVLVLRIEWASGQAYSWYSTNVAQPATGAAVSAANHTVSDLSLYLSVETDEQIIQSLREKVNSSGLQVLIPYVYHFKNNLTGNSQNISLRFNSAHGLSLCKIYTAPFNSVETRELCVDHANANGAIISSYYTMIDNSRLTEFDLTCTNANPRDYMYMKDQLRGTPMEQLDVFRYNWVHVEDFSKDYEINEDPNTINGLLLTQQEKKFDLQATSVSAVNPLNWYTFAVTKRRLNISSQMININ